MKKPFRTEIIEGETLHLAERDLTPQVRVAMHVNRQAFVGEDDVSGHGWGFIHMCPVAVIERRDSNEQRIPIQNETSQKLTRMLVAALVVPGLAMLIIAIWRALVKLAANDTIKRPR